MFAETANVDYLLSFADQGKRASVFRFPFSLYIYFETAADIYTYRDIEIYIYISLYISNLYLYIYIFIYYICCCFKRKTEAQAIFLNPFTVGSSCKQKFVVCLERNK
jgi:hypothetical protein